MLAYSDFRKIKDQNSFEDDHWHWFDGVEHSFDMFVLAGIIASNLNASLTVVKNDLHAGEFLL